MTTSVGGRSLIGTESTPLSTALELFQLENRARRYSPITIDFYQKRLLPFTAWCRGQGASRLQDVTPALLRAYLVASQERGLAAHTVHGIARALRTWLVFCVQEELIVKSPMEKVAMPRLPKKILPALEIVEVQRLLSSCETERDKAAVLFLVDTGVRASEFVHLNGADVDVALGTVAVREGKGSKDRTTYIGVNTRKQLERYYLDAGRPVPNGPIWRSLKTGERLTTSGLRRLLLRLGDAAGVEHCAPHTFRRTFALWSLRSGMSIYHLQRLMGHEDIEVLRQYLDLVDQDTAGAHERFGAVDNVLGRKRSRGPP
jgi:site-specific recombinase XerD